MALPFVENPTQDSQSRSSFDPTATNDAVLGSSTITGDNTNRLDEFVDNETYERKFFNSQLRSRNIPEGANPTPIMLQTASWKATGAQDWRVRLSIPPGISFGPLHRSIARTNGLIWPYTPTVSLGTFAAYSEQTPTHALYPYVVYQNSGVSDISISGTFTCQTEREADYIIAAQQYLKTVTKSAYANSAFQGSPPPVVTLTGYGRHVLPNVPVVVKQWNISLPSDVDYIQSSVGAYAPTKCEITANMQIAISRGKSQTFSLQGFAAGALDGFL